MKIGWREQLQAIISAHPGGMRGYLELPFCEMADSIVHVTVTDCYGISCMVEDETLMKKEIITRWSTGYCTFFDIQYLIFHMISLPSLRSVGA